MGSSDNESDHHRHHSKDHSDSVIDPALRTSPSAASADKKQGRVEMSSPRRPQPPPSPPPPITTMSSSNNSHSPSPSVISGDRSSTSTPHIRRSPPHHPMQPPAMYPAYQHDHPIMQSNPHHSNHFVPRPEPIGHPYIYTHPQFDPRYDHRQHHHDPHRQPYPMPSAYPLAPMSHPQAPQHPHPGSMHDNYGRQYPLPGQPPVTIVHTDDAATKLTDGIRRRCFNCCTTDTSTWRRSNLSPGKVLCNKCGLFERTHSRPRPDQFPHKRGPLAASALRGRTPPGAQLPPISAAPYQYHHQPITPLSAGEYHHPHTLPGLQTWHSNSQSNSSGSSGNNANASGGGSNNSHGANSSEGNRRSTHDNTPRTKHQPASRASGAARAPFDEPLSSNAAVSSDRSPPASVSRSSTSNAGGGGSGAPSKVSKEKPGSTSNTPPPPPSSSSTGTGTGSRD